jgi:hypothetical protein
VPARRDKWEHEPTSTPLHPDTVPSKSLPPLGSLDRMANGVKLGQCPTCGGHRWWDNCSRKAMGEMDRSAPDYACAACRHGRWLDGRQRAGRQTTPRTPPVTVSVLPKHQARTRRAERGDGARTAGHAGGTCSALKRDGKPCRNRAMAGSRFCGPHSDDAYGATAAPRQCRGTTKAGQPCRAGAVRGGDYCPQHVPR